MFSVLLQQQNRIGINLKIPDVWCLCFSIYCYDDDDDDFFMLRIIFTVITHHIVRNGRGVLSYLIPYFSLFFYFP